MISIKARQQLLEQQINSCAADVQRVCNAVCKSSGAGDASCGRDALQRVAQLVRAAPNMACIQGYHAHDATTWVCNDGSDEGLMPLYFASRC